MKGGNHTSPFTDQSLVKQRRSKSREVSSRFLSPTSPSHSNGTPSSSQASSPIRHKPTETTRKPRSLEEPGYIRGLWPSSSPSLQLSNKQTTAGTLGEHLKNERLEDFLERKKEVKPAPSSNASLLSSLGRQRSGSEFSRFENEKEKVKESAKENHRPLLGGSMRYTGKLFFPRRSSASSSSSSSSSNSPFNNPVFVPGRLSVDENALYRNSESGILNRGRSDSFRENQSDQSDCSDICSSTDNSSATIGANHRKFTIEVSSKFMNDIQGRSRMGTSDSKIQVPVSLDTSPRIKKFAIKNTIKRANSLTTYGSATSQWALSPGRSGSPPMSVESKERPVSFSSLKPPSSPSRPKGVEKLLNLGLDLFKSKKSSSNGSILVGSGSIEHVHQLRLLHNRLMQWRYANARADAVNGNTNKQVADNLLYASDSISKLRHSVLSKKLQLQKEKLEMKLDFIIHSQIKLLESWGDIERQQSSAVSMTQQCLHSVVCKVPLIEGAKMDTQSASVAIRQVSDLTTSIKFSLTNFASPAEKTVLMISQLAEIVAQEKLLLEECLELLQTISVLEVQERSLKTYIIQLSIWQQQASLGQRQQSEWLQQWQ